MLDSVFAALSYRTVGLREPLAWFRHAWLTIKEWFNVLEVAQPLLFRVVIYLLVAGMLALVCHAAWGVITDVRSAAAADDATRHAAPRRDEAWFRREADRLARA